MTSLVDVWVARLDHAAERAAGCLPLLSPDEVARANRFAADRLRDRFVLSRGLTRRILASCAGKDPRCLRFLYEHRGKPSLEGQTWHFNVSHSQSLLVCAVTQARPLGVDVEEVRPLKDAMSVARGFFSAEEAKALQLLPPQLQTAAFFECWTRKEAFIKATGAGLSRGLAAFAVSLGPGTEPRFERIEAGDPAAGVCDPSRRRKTSWAPWQCVRRSHCACMPLSMTKPPNGSGRFLVVRGRPVSEREPPPQVRFGGCDVASFAVSSQAPPKQCRI